MFKSYDHFKKTTQELFKDVQNSKIKKLSDLRNLLAEKVGYSSVQALACALSDKAVSNSGRLNIASVIYVDSDGMVSEKIDYLDTPENNKIAEVAFVTLAQQYVSNFDEYSSDEIEVALEDGYLGFGNSSIQIVHST